MGLPQLVTDPSLFVRAVGLGVATATTTAIALDATVVRMGLTRAGRRGGRRRRSAGQAWPDVTIRVLSLDVGVQAVVFGLLLLCAALRTGRGSGPAARAADPASSAGTVSRLVTRAEAPRGGATEHAAATPRKVG